MAHAFLSVDREQRFLLPPDMREWLPADHPVWFVTSIVERLDVSELVRSYRLEAQGRRAHDPTMMLTLLVWAYSQGVRSSRRIEAACREGSLAFRVICGPHIPDHATIARFRQRHEDVFRSLFVQVLAICADAGLDRLGILAVDGTKMGANAALDANRDRARLEAEVERALAEADAIDAVEDEQFGDARGDELPDDLADPRRRAERLNEILARHDAGRGEDEPDADGDAEVNLTDPESRVMKGATGGFCQGYNAQLVVTDDQVIVAAEVTNAQNDVGLLWPMFQAATENLTSAGVSGEPEFVVGDAGYWCQDTLADEPEDGPTALIATTNRRGQPREPADPLDADDERAERDAIAEAAASERARRAPVYERIDAGELSYRRGALELGLNIETVHRGVRAWRAGGVDAIPVPRRAGPRITSAARARHTMETRLADPDNRARYRRRAPLVEGVFAQIKHHRHARSFSRRGRAAADSEWKLHAIVHNILKLRGLLARLTDILAPRPLLATR